jgi:GDP-L-fucose synthase
VGGIYANKTQKVEFLIRNLELQNSLISAAREARIPKLIFLGSSCIYPKLAPQPITEESLLTGSLEPTNEAYAIAKIAGLKLCEYIREEDGLDFFSLMPTNLYGPGDNYDRLSSHVPAALIRKFHEARLNGDNHVKIWGTGLPKREFLHVDDLASAIWFTLANSPQKSFLNVGSGHEITIMDFAFKISKMVGFEGKLEFDCSFPDGTPRKLLNSSEIFNMGWRPQISLDEGLKNTYQWFLNNSKLGLVKGYE